MAHGLRNTAVDDWKFYTVHICTSHWGGGQKLRNSALAVELTLTLAKVTGDTGKMRCRSANRFVQSYANQWQRWH